MPADIINISDRTRKLDPPEATDAMFDTTDAGMVRRLSTRMLALIGVGNDSGYAKQNARLAFSFARRVQQDLEQLGVEVNRG